MHCDECIRRAVKAEQDLEYTRQLAIDQTNIITKRNQHIRQQKKQITELKGQVTILERKLDGRTRTSDS